MVATTATTLSVYAARDLVLGETTWACLTLLAVGVLEALVTIASRGIVTYALTVIWALVSISIANLGSRWTVAATVASATVLVALDAQSFSEHINNA